MSWLEFAGGINRWALYLELVKIFARYVLEQRSSLTYKLASSHLSPSRAMAFSIFPRSPKILRIKKRANMLVRSFQRNLERDWQIQFGLRRCDQVFVCVIGRQAGKGKNELRLILESVHQGGACQKIRKRENVKKKTIKSHKSWPKIKSTETKTLRNREKRALDKKTEKMTRIKKAGK